MTNAPRPEFGRRGAQKPSPPAAPSTTRKRGALTSPVALTLAAAGVGAVALVALAPSGPTCEERKQQNPAETCSSSRSSFFLFLPFGSAPQAQAQPPAPRPAAAGLRAAIPDVAPAARPSPAPGVMPASPPASAAPAAVSRGGFGASAGSFFSGGG
jgi:hypothetical protein